MLFQGMKELKEFCIPFSSLKLGPNFFDFEIDNRSLIFLIIPVTLAVIFL
jgi:hypothetical protein